MTLFKGSLAVKIVDKTNNTFPLDGMIGPTFYNIGKTTVTINQLEVLPGESYPVELPNMVHVGNINIQFVDEVGKVNMLLVNYAIYREPFHERPISEAEQLATYGNCQ